MIFESLNFITMQYLSSSVHDFQGDGTDIPKYLRNVNEGSSERNTLICHLHSPV